MALMRTMSASVLQPKIINACNTFSSVNLPAIYLVVSFGGEKYGVEEPVTPVGQWGWGAVA